jgi:hypothetical protein
MSDHDPTRVPEEDPTRLADEREQEVDKLQRQTDKLGDDVKDVAEDWQRKRADADIPGAPPPEDEDEDEGEEEQSSPAPQAPPEESGPSKAEMPSEGAAGPPADTEQDD